MESERNAFVASCRGALGDLAEGWPAPFKAPWSHADDVVIMGAFGGYERGRYRVSARLDRASRGIKPQPGPGPVAPA